MRSLIAPIATALLIAACSDEASSKEAPPSAGATFETGTELRVSVPATGRVYVRLSPPGIVTPPGDPKTSPDWDLAFEGFDIFTNSGMSGSGKGAAFGPLDAAEFASDTAPQVPFLTQDKAGGAFLEWYAYEETSHSIWSRYHVYGVRDGARLWKVQILSYYGRRDGAVASALYKARYAELTEGADATPHDLVDLDGSAGGVSGSAVAASGCVDFGSGERTMLSPDAARASNAWHLCFRRDAISVNGELGGPRGVTAVDLDADKLAGEAISSVKAKTEESESAAFSAATLASFDGKSFRGDRIVNAFSDKWIATGSSPVAPKPATWLAQDAKGTQKFFLGFSRFEGPTTTSPGTVVVFIKPVKG